MLHLVFSSASFHHSPSHLVVYMAVMADSGISHSTAMATRICLLVFVAVLACLMQTSSAGHKKKIIVKVPHIIKHIHHDHYKPIHVHKVRQKKVEHHHHKKSEGKHKTHGSYSHLRPVLIHKGSEEQVEHSGDQSQGREYNLRNHYGRGLEYEPGREYGQQTGWRSGNNNGYWNTRDSTEDSHEETWKPVGLMSWMNDEPNNGEYSGEEWPMYGDQSTEYREGRGLSTGRRKKNSNQVAVKTKQEPEDHGWRPMMDFSGWRDDKDLRNKPREDPSEQYNYSGENYSDGSGEERYAENIYKKQNKSKKNKKKKWNKQIEVREPSNERELSHIPTLPVQQQQLNIPQPVKPNPQPAQWPFPVQQPQKEQNKWPALPQIQHQQWISPRPTATTWHAPSTTPKPTEAAQPMVVWSGHHLQLPQQTMWQVQQHSVQVPVSVTSTPPRPALPVHPSPLLSLRQQQPSPQLQQASFPVQQVSFPAQQASFPSQQASFPAQQASFPAQQASFPVQQVQLPSWPMNHKTTQGLPQVKQHWEQSVVTSGKDGPASSYKVEVINYADQKNNRA